MTSLTKVVALLACLLPLASTEAQQARIVGVRPIHFEGQAISSEPISNRIKEDSSIQPKTAEPEREKNGLERYQAKSAALEKLRKQFPATTLSNVSVVPIKLDKLILSSIQNKLVISKFEGRLVVDDSTAHDIEIAKAKLSASSSVFDPSIRTLLRGSDINRPPESFFGPGLSQNDRRDEGEFLTTLSKPFSSGLVASIGYEPSLAYLFVQDPSSGSINPAHSSDVVVRLNQPLLRGKGAVVNKAVLSIAESRLVQERAKIVSDVQAQLRSIEEVYWKLFAEWERLEAIKEARELSFQMVDIALSRFDAGRAIYTDVAKAMVRVESLYQQQLNAESEIKSTTLVLCQLSGLPMNIEVVVFPVDKPIVNPPKLDITALISNGMHWNPNLLAKRQDIEIIKTQCAVAENGMLPQFDIQASHRTSGIDDDLGTSLQQMGSFRFNDFTLGVEFSKQLGNRRARSNLRAAKLNVNREFAIFQALEQQTSSEILTLANDSTYAYAKIESALRQLEQVQGWVELSKVRYEDPPVSNASDGNSLLIFDYQNALQAKIDAIGVLVSAVADYNVILAIIDEKCGKLIDRWGVQVHGLNAE